MCSSLVSHTWCFLCQRQLRVCLIECRVSTVVIAWEVAVDGSQFLGSQVLLVVVWRAVEDPEQGLLVEVLDLAFDWLDVCYVVAVWKSEPISIHGRPWRRVVVERVDLVGYRPSSIS